MITRTVKFDESSYNIIDAKARKLPYLSSYADRILSLHTTQWMLMGISKDANLRFEILSRIAAMSSTHFLGVLNLVISKSSNSCFPLTRYLYERMIESRYILLEPDAYKYYWLKSLDDWFKINATRPNAQQHFVKQSKLYLSEFFQYSDSKLKKLRTPRKIREMVEFRSITHNWYSKNRDFKGVESYIRKYLDEYKDLEYAIKDARTMLTLISHASLDGVTGFMNSNPIGDNVIIPCSSGKEDNACLEIGLMSYIGTLKNMYMFSDYGNTVNTCNSIINDIVGTWFKNKAHSP